MFKYQHPKSEMFAFKWIFLSTASSKSQISSLILIGQILKQAKNFSLPHHKHIKPLEWNICTYNINHLVSAVFVLMSVHHQGAVSKSISQATAFFLILTCCHHDSKRERKTESKKNRQIERETNRDSERQTAREIDTEEERNTDRKREMFLHSWTYSHEPETKWQLSSAY